MVETVSSKYALCTTRDDLTVVDMYLAGALRMDIEGESVFKLGLALSNLRAYLKRYCTLIMDEIVMASPDDECYVNKFIAIQQELAYRYHYGVRTDVEK